MMFGRSPLSADDGTQGASDPSLRNAVAGPPATPSRAPTSSPRPAEPTQGFGAGAARPRSGISALSAAFRFEGDITGEADLQLDGQVKGDIRVARLVVGPGARVEGAVRAHHVEVRGHVIGSIEAQAVFLYESGRVEGDITPGRLSIEGGAHFDGRVCPMRAAKMESAASSPEPIAPAAAEAPRTLAVVGDGAAEPSETPTAA